VLSPFLRAPSGVLSPRALFILPLLFGRPVCRKTHPPRGQVGLTTPGGCPPPGGPPFLLHYSELSAPFYSGPVETIFTHVGPLKGKVGENPSSSGPYLQEQKGSLHQPKKCGNQPLPTGEEW